MPDTGLALIRRARFEAFRPPPALKVSEWADAERILSAESASEPGPWRTGRAEFQRGVMNAVHEENVEIVVVITASQVGKTSIGENVLGYHIDHQPTPTLLVEPTLEMALAFSKDRLSPMLRDTPALHGKVQDARVKGSTTATLLHKTFPGGHLTLAGANSASSLASRPIRLLICDEVDRWPATLPGEGDPLLLAMKRTATFWDRKILILSTPTTKGFSRIEHWFEQSDQRRFFVPCPACGHLHVLQWANVVWSPDPPEAAHLVCPQCSAIIKDTERLAMIQEGQWQPTAETSRPIAGFHLNELYSPWRKLGEIAADFVAAKRGGNETLRTFINCSLGESWEEPSESVDPASLMLRREKFAAEIPAGACCLTLGVDTQDDRLEALLVAWGPGEESWILRRETLPGDPAYSQPWQQLDELLNRTWRHEAGLDLPIISTCVDSAGHKTAFVYSFVVPRQIRRVFASIGRGGGGHAFVSPAKTMRTNAGTVHLRMVDPDQGKATFFSRLRLTEHGPGYVHIGMDVDDETLAQLTSEKLVKKFERGVATQTWTKTRHRNEALDGYVLALAAVRLVAGRPGQLQAMADRIAEAAGHQPTQEADTSGEPPAPTSRPAPSSTDKPWLRPVKRRRFSKSTYLDY